METLVVTLNVTLIVIFEATLVITLIVAFIIYSPYHKLSSNLCHPKL